MKGGKKREMKRRETECERKEGREEERRIVGRQCER